MSGIKYKVIHLHGQNIEGNAAKIVIKDQLAPMTLFKDHGPTLAVLKTGKITFLDNEDHVQNEVSYGQGTLSISDNLCTITIIRTE